MTTSTLVPPSSARRRQPVPRIALALARRDLRGAAWPPLAAAIAAGIGVVSLAGPAVLELRVAAIAICIGAAFVFDDPAREGLASSPTPVSLRRLLRVLLMLPLLAAGWALVLWRARSGFDPAVTLEFAAMLAATLAAAAVAARRVPDGGGVVAAAALPVSLGAALILLPDCWTLFAFGPDDPRWQASHQRWAALLIVAVLVLALASRDPAGRRTALRLIRRRAPVVRVTPLPEGETP